MTCADDEVFFSLPFHAYTIFTIVCVYTSREAYDCVDVHCRCHAYTYRYLQIIIDHRSERTDICEDKTQCVLFDDERSNNNNKKNKNNFRIENHFPPKWLTLHRFPEKVITYNKCSDYPGKMKQIYDRSLLDYFITIYQIVMSNLHKN